LEKDANWLAVLKVFRGMPAKGEKRELSGRKWKNLTWGKRAGRGGLYRISKTQQRI